MFWRSGLLNKLLCSLDRFQNQQTAESPSALSSSQSQSESKSSTATKSATKTNFKDFFRMLFGGGSTSQGAIQPETTSLTPSSKAGGTQKVSTAQKAPPAQKATTSSSTASTGDMSRCLSSHNKFRSAGGSPKLVWDESLAASAQAWANNLVGRPGLSLSHSRNGNGENLYGGMGGSYNCDSAVTSWHNEKPRYNGGPISRFGVSSYGHYTQLMWKSTKKLGCAAARSGSKVIYVCQYFPAGNRIGTSLGNS